MQVPSDPLANSRGVLPGLLAIPSEIRHVGRYADRPAHEYKGAARANWSAVACGTDAALAARHTREYFEEIERYRYGTQPWTAEAIDRLPVDGRRVLELGFGAGTDHLRLARRVARITGIDLTPQNFVETTRRFAHDGRRPRLAVADMESLPFRAAAFDLVFSFGVLHHTPDIDQALREVTRVLAPGGRAWVAVYHRRSVFFWWSVFGFGFLLKGGFRRRSLRAQLSRVEHPNTNEGLVVRLHTRREIGGRFGAAGFEKVCTRVIHIVPGDVAGLDVLLSSPEKPRAWLSWLGRFWGWYVVVEAERPGTSHLATDARSSTRGADCV
jgi:SAM-dependent methyltransferase